MPHRTRHLLPGLLAGVCTLLAAAQPVEVATELERLMNEHGFEVRGVELTLDHQGRAEGEALIPRVRMLLEQFDYVMLQTPAGGLERLIILGEKTAAAAPVPQPPPPAKPQAANPPRTGGAAATPPTEAAANPADEAAATPDGEIEIKTQRVGASHVVTLTLEGANGQRLPQPLLVDTGADQIVLPASLIGPLGLDPGQLSTRTVQTANGQVAARLGTLPGVWLGTHRAAAVPTAFIEDGRLGGTALLGMSLLGRFRMTLDDGRLRLGGR